MCTLEMQEGKNAPTARLKKTAGKLAAIHGMDALKVWGEDLARDLKGYKAGKLTWGDVDPGALVHGPPGTGKSMFAKVLAETCKVPLIATSYAKWQRAGDGHLGDVLSKMAHDFEMARSKAPCILAIDELDTLPTRGSGRSHRDDWWHSVVNALLELLSGIEKSEGVVVVGICNDPKQIDPALKRAGRLDRTIHVPLPTVDDLAKIIRFHLDKSEAKALGDLSTVAVLCQGMTGAEVEKLLRDARRLARRQRRALAIDDIIFTIDPMSRDLDLDRRIAVHEAGHAIAAVRYGMAGGMTLSIVPRQGSGGRITTAAQNGAMTRQKVMRILTMTLAGRAAEEIIIGSVSSGAGGGPDSDLGRAHLLAYEAVANLGLSQDNAPRWVGSVRALTLDSNVPAEISSLIDEAYAKAQALVRKNEKTVKRLGKALIARRALTEADIRNIVDRKGKRARADSVPASE